MGRGKGNRKSGALRPSKSARKRDALAVLELVEELIGLPATLVAELPADEEIRHLIREAQPLSGGARKRLVKFIAKQLRAGDTAPLFTFVAERRGSRLQEKQRLHRLERLRDDLVSEVIALLAEVEAEEEETLDPEWPSPVLAAIDAALPGIDTGELRRLALAYARSRKKVHSRQIFRPLAAADERLRLQQTLVEETA